MLVDTMKSLLRIPTNTISQKNEVIYLFIFALASILEIHIYCSGNNVLYISMLRLTLSNQQKHSVIMLQNI